MKEKKEQWRRCADNHAVSDMGRIKNLKTGRFLKPCKAKRGYLVVNIRKEGIRKCFCMHRLVAEAFCEKPVFEKSGLQVNHINGIKTDNRAANLEWTTPSENLLHAYYQLGIRVMPVEVKRNGRPKGCFPSLSWAARYYGTRKEIIWRGQCGWSMKPISIAAYNAYVEDTLMQTPKLFRYAGQ